MRALLLALIAAHVVLMVLFPTIARLPSAVWDDMLEAWAWGKEFQLGYYKHPPFYSWIVGFWFEIFPRTDASYYLLSAINIGVGLLGVWRLSRLFLGKYAGLAAVSLSMLAPSYHYPATNFNANSILLSLWPWAAYFFVRSLQSNSWKDGVFFGILGGCALLSKYFSILFLASCFFAALLHPRRHGYFRSVAPYSAVVACGLVVAPHIVWAFNSGLPTVEYALRTGNHPHWLNTYQGLRIGAMVITIYMLAAAALLAALGRRRISVAPRVWRFLKAPSNAWLVVLGLGPIVATLSLGIAGFVKVGLNFMIPTVYILPLMVLAAVAPMMTPGRVRATMSATAAFMAFALAASPIIAYATVALHVEDRQQVSAEIARVATSVWHAQMHAPVRIATGTEAFSLALPFYSPDSPEEFTHFSSQQAPWITPERIAGEGILCVCEASDRVCLEQAKRYETPETKRIVRRFQKIFWGLSGRVIEVVMIIVPPRPNRTPVNSD
jgi:4-amino-4-deoxy-L-arabinose transferase-like glycosyltransferase